MTQSAVARFERGGRVPSLPVLERLAAASDGDLVVSAPSGTRARLINGPIRSYTNQIGPLITGETQ